MKGKPTRKCSIFLVVVMVVGAFLNAFAWLPQAAKAAGSGTADDPYIITTAAELNNIRSNLGGHYRLGGNINLSAYTNWEPIGTTVTPFTGSLDGDRFTVSNLKIVRPTEDYVGLFGSVKGSISRINLANVDVQGKDYTGGLLGAISSGQVEEATVTGTVQGTNNVGGLGGLFSNTAAVNASSANVNVYGQKNLGGFLGAYASKTLVSDISAAGNVNVFGAGSSGGLIGVFTSTAILRNSHASGNVVIPVAMSTQRIGGLIGEFSTGKIQYCYATGNVGSISFSGQNYYAIGGLVGYSVGTIEKSYATGITSVNGLETNVGGFVGQAAGGSITNNYAMGKVFAPSPLSAGIGGFIGSSRATLKNNYSAVATSFTGSTGSSFLGKKEGGTVSGNYFDVNIAGTANSIDAAPKATTDMKIKATFVGWDFDTVWSIDEGVSYPQLRPYVATYSVTYNGNGSTSGQAPADSGLYPTSGTVTVLDNTGMLKRSGFVFAGWNSKADGTGDDYAPASSFSMPSRNLTLYATWIPLTYTIEAIQTQTLSPLTAGYNPGTQETKTVTITKTGTGSLTNLNVQLSGTAAGSFELTGLATTELNDGTPSTTFTVKAKNQLPAGTYQATVTVAAELMTAVTFTVEQVVTEVVNAAEPTLTAQPVGSTVKVGDTRPTLSVTADVTDGGTLSYQWYSNMENSTSGSTEIAGATGSSYEPLTTTAGTTYYYVVVKNTNTEATGAQTTEKTSHIAAVTVNPPVPAASPTILNHPYGDTVYAGDIVTLGVTATKSDAGTLSYQWYSNAVESMENATLIEDATADFYQPAADIAGVMYYYVAVKNTLGSQSATTFSSIAMVTIKAAPVTGDWIDITGYRPVNGPIDVAASNDGTLYVADAYQLKRRVVDGGWQAITPPVGQITGITTDSNGALYLIMKSSSMVLKYSEGLWGFINAEGLSDPVDVAVDNQGNIYAADTEFRRIMKLVGNQWENVTDSYINAAGLAVGPDGTIYVTDHNNRVKKLSGSSWVDITGEASFLDPKGIGVDSHGNVYVADTGNSVVRKLAGNQWTDVSIKDEFFIPYGMFVAGNGEVYVCDIDAGLIKKLVAPALAPSITTQPTGATVKVGDADPVLSVAANSMDDGQLSYQWFRNDTASTSGAFIIENATGSSYTVSTENESDRYYYVVVTNTKNAVNGNKTAEVTSAFVRVTVQEVVNAAQPVITTQPVPSTVKVGDANPVLSVAANSTDDGQLSYQWFRNDTASTSGAFTIEDATGSSYTVSTENESDRYYYVVIKNTKASVNGNKTAEVTSAFVRVTVQEVVNAAQPTITTQPIPSTVKVGDADPVLSVAANSTDDGQLSYQWFRNDTASTSGAFIIEDATGSSYTVSTENESDRYYYVVVKNTKNAVNGNKTAEVTSAFVRVKVEEVVNAAQPTITTQPIPSTVKVGDANPVLSVAANSTDDGQLSYQWFRNDTASTSGAFIIENATGSSYTVSTENESDRYYYVVVTNTKNAVNGNKTAEVTSAFVRVTVQEVVNAAQPTITTQPIPSTVKVGDANPVLSVVANSTDDGQLSYQWYRNDTASTSGAFTIEDATGSSYTISTEQESDRYYYVVIKNTKNAANGNTTAEITSAFVRVTVTGLVHAEEPWISSQPVSVTVNAGDSPVLSVTAQSTDDGTLSYQWYSNTANSVTGASAIPSVTGSTYAAPTTVLGTVYYYVVVTNTNHAINGNPIATVTSDIVAVTVNELINAAVPVLSAQPVGAIVNLGEAGPTLSVAVHSTDGGLLSYQWYSNTSNSTKGGAAIPDGIGSTYTAPTAEPGTTYYYVIVTSLNQAANGNQTATVISEPVAVTVNPPAPTHTVLFDSQGGSAVAGVTNALHGSKLTAPVSPSKSGYSFSGWYKDAAGTVAWNFDTDLVTGDVTLYAKWTEISNGGDTGGNSGDDTNGGSDGVTGSQPGGTPVPANDAVIVLVNGREEKIGKSASSTEGDRTVTTITVNPQQLEDKLQAEGQGAVVTIPVSAQSDVIVGELNGQMVKNMEDKQAVLVVQTGHASYTIPSLQVDIGSISKQLGSAAALEEIKVQIRIAEPEAAMLKVGEAANGQNGLTLVAPPVHFTVEASYEGQTIEVTTFNAYVKRTIALPEGIDPNKITTGIVTEADGSVRHVPTKITVIGGKYYAQINSLTNSMYSVIWHPLTFKDVEQHWAQQDVNDMGSRLVVNGVGDGLFNPDAAITRAEFAAIVMRGLGLKPVGGSAVFTDVQASDWYYTAVQTTSNYKLIDGFEDGSFRPNEKITREQAMLIIARAMAVTKLQGKLPAKEIGEVLKPFADAAAVSNWAKTGITASLQAGLVTGRSADELAPQASITRAEVATIVKRLLKESGLI